MNDVSKNDNGYTPHMAIGIKFPPLVQRMKLINQIESNIVKI